MAKAKSLAIGFGIAAAGLGTVVVIFLSLATFQGSEVNYINDVNRLTSDLNRVNMEINSVATDLSSNRIYITQAKFQLSSLVNDADKLHKRASSMSVPEKYKSVHPHLVQGLDYYVSSFESSKNAIEYTEKALQSSQNFETLLYSDIISVILGSASLQSLSAMSEVYSNTEAAKAAYHDANRYGRLATDEFTKYFSMTNLMTNISYPNTTSEQVLRDVSKQSLLEECKELGIPEFSCTEQTLLAKRRIVAAGQQGAYGSGTP